MSFDFAPSGGEAASILGLSIPQRKRMEQMLVASRDVRDVHGNLVFHKMDPWIAASMVKAMFEANGAAVPWEGGAPKVTYSTGAPFEGLVCRVRATITADGQTFKLGVTTVPRADDQKKHDAAVAELKQTVAILCALPAEHRQAYVDGLRRGL